MERHLKKVFPAKAQRRKAKKGSSLRLCAFAGTFFLSCAFIFTAFSQITDLSGLTELKKGDYENAFKLLSARLAANPNDTIAQRGLLRVFLETGRYAEAEASAKKFLLKAPEAAAVRHELAETLAITGRYTEAIAEFERAAADADKSDATPGARLESDLRRAELLELIGQEDRAKDIYGSFVKYYTGHDPETALELTLIARALVHLEKFQDANDMYRSAIEADCPSLLRG